MDVTPLIPSDRQVIQSYRGGVFKISNVTYNSAVFVLPDRVIEWQPSFAVIPAEAGIQNSFDMDSRLRGKDEMFRIEDFELLKPFASDIEVLLFGTGAKQIMLSPALRQAIKQEYGFTIEAMDTGAACRTYNVLMAEGRRIAAALL